MGQIIWCSVIPLLSPLSLQGQPVSPVRAPASTVCTVSTHPCESHGDSGLNHTAGWGFDGNHTMPRLAHQSRVGMSGRPMAGVVGLP